jgi:CRP-like cAMP-binding protein
MKEKKIPNKMKRRIIKYIEYMQEQSDSAKIDESVILDRLSYSLKSELIVEIKGRIINNFPLFSSDSDYFTRKFIFEITLIISERISLPEEDIISTSLHQEEHDDYHLYFIKTGEVEIFHKESQTVLANLKDGAFFGELSFISD